MKVCVQSFQPPHVRSLDGHQHQIDYIFVMLKKRYSFDLSFRSIPLKGKVRQPPIKMYPTEFGVGGRVWGVLPCTPTTYRQYVDDPNNNYIITHNVQYM